MNRILLDTDTLSEVYKGRNNALKFQAQEYCAEWGRLTISAVTVMEVIRGVWLKKSTKSFTAIVKSLGSEEVLPFSADTAHLAGKIQAELQRIGMVIGRADPMIAATAIEHGLVLVTGNSGHFDRIRQLGFPLLLANWRDADS